MKIFRFSLEWSRFQPHSKNDEFDKSVTKHYHKIIDELLKNGIKPSLTFFHFSLPVWYEKMGGFQKRENSIYFEKFCEFAFKEYSPKVTHFATINEPSIYSEASFIEGAFPPGGQNPINAMKVIGNLLHSHTVVYHKLKKMKNGKKCQIGIVKNVQQSNSYSQWNPLEWFIAKNFEYVHDHAVINYFKTGAYKIPVPFIGISYLNEKGKNSLDFVGLNYYTHNILKVGCLSVTPTHRAWEEVTDMEWSLYGEGLYYSLKYLSNLKVPIYITENGIADKKKDPFMRNLFYRRYMYALAEAMNEGVDVRGCMTWSLLDNFEWAKGYQMKFGLFNVNRNTQERTLKKGVEFYLDLADYFYKKNTKEIKVEKKDKEEKERILVITKQ